MLVHSDFSLSSSLLLPTIPYDEWFPAFLGESIYSLTSPISSTITAPGVLAGIGTMIPGGSTPAPARGGAGGAGFF